MNLHIIPVNDTIYHLPSSDCPCKPCQDTEAPMIIHNAIDGREATERAEELLGITPDADWVLDHGWIIVRERSLEVVRGCVEDT